MRYYTRNYIIHQQRNGGEPKWPRGGERPASSGRLKLTIAYACWCSSPGRQPNSTARPVPTSFLPPSSASNRWTPITLGASLLGSAASTWRTLRARRTRRVAHRVPSGVGRELRHARRAFKAPFVGTGRAARRSCARLGPCRPAGDPEPHFPVPREGGHRDQSSDRALRGRAARDRTGAASLHWGQPHALAWGQATRPGIRSVAPEN